MRKIALTILACAVPAGLCAQQAELSDIQASEDPSATAIGESAENGVRIVLPKEDLSSTFLPSELVQAAGISQDAIQAGGFLAGRKHKVVKGDTLRSLAEKYYKDPSLWGRIYNANFNIVANPDYLNPKEEIIIPDMNGSAASYSNDGLRVVLPKADSSSQIISGELVAAVGIPLEALQSGGFVVGKLYTVVKGDTLWRLSGKYYNNPFLWGRIYNANYKTVANPDRINPKEELIIPDISEIVIPYRQGRAARAGTDAAGEESSGLTEVQGRGAVSGSSASAARKAALVEPEEIFRDFDRNFLSEEMPEQQKEWPDGMKIVPDSWSEDGEITAGLKGDSDSMDESFSLSGEEVEIFMAGPGRVKPGDYLAVYLKGGDARDKSGKRLGRELQPAGLAEVVSVDGSVVKARVINATTAISKGCVVKKK